VNIKYIYRERDIIVKSKSGTGKTIVFTVVALETIDTTKKYPTVLILCPTREIAVQVQQVIQLVGCCMEGLKVESFIGGTPLNEDKEKCNNCHIVVGTPGRIKHLINEGTLKSEYLSLFVLDEADKLMEDSFLSDINEIYNALPAKKQIVTTSATYPNSLEKHLSEYMVSPTFVTAELETPLLLGLKQFVSVVDKPGDMGVQIREKTDELRRILSTVTYTQCLVFFNYQGLAESVTNVLNRCGWQAVCIHAGRSQPERLAAMEKFKAFKFRVLTSTDLTARGIDAANVDLVINFDIPSDAMTYLHRMGRAGRYGSTGACINITLERELTDLQKILGCIGGSGITIQKLPEFAGSIQDLLKIEVTPENCINGIVSDTPFKDIRSRINELKKGKQAGNPKQKTATKATKKAKKEAKPAGDGTKILEAVKESVSETGSNAILASLAAGTFQFDTEAKAKESLQSSSKTAEVEKKENLESSPKKEVSEMDNAAILASLASGTFKFDTLPQLTQTNKETEEDTMVSVKNMRSPTSSSESNKKCLKKPKREDIYCKNKALLDVTKILINADSVRPEDTSLQDCLDTLKLNEKDKVLKFAKKEVPELLDAIKSGGSSESSGCGSKVDPIETEASSSTKNIGEVDIERVFEVAYNTIVRSVKDDNLDAYVEKLQTKAGNAENLNGSVSMVVNDGLSEDSEECEEPVEIMKWVPVKPGKNDRNRSGQMPNAEQDTTLWVMNQNQDEEIVEDEDEEDNLEGEEEGYDPEYDRANEAEMTRWRPEDDGYAGDPQQRYRHQYAVQTAHNDVERYDHLQQYFDGCSESLWDNGLRFADVASFDEWFYYEWEAQLYAVRNYVQQNIYLEEMNKCRNFDR
ncbi:unnamed protein product, partial [Callosobruchus maculatus]